MVDPVALVADLETRLRPLEQRANLAWWEASVRATEQSERRRAEADLELSDLLAEPAPFVALRAAREHGVDDPLLARRLDVLVDTFAPHQLPPELRRRVVELQASVESTFAAHRGHLRGRPVDDNEIARILRTSDDDDERRQVWEASKTVGTAVADRVRELARTRNEGARALGFRDHFALALATNELDEVRLLATLDEVDAATAAPFAAWKADLDAHRAARFRCDPDDLRPWHYDDPFFQDPPVDDGVDLDAAFAGRDVQALTVRTYDGLGLDLRPVLARSDLLPRPNKNQHAFCIDVDRDGDVRVLANVVPNERWMETLLHEFGHAVYFAEVERTLPWLLRTMHALTTEGVAMLFGRLPRDPEWLTGVVGLDAAEVGSMSDRLRAARRAGLLVFARWVLVMTRFERELYRDPDSDLDRLWWDLVEQFQRVRRPDGRDAPDWAAKIHLAAAPVYYQNYLYGEMVASQLHATLRREVGGLVERTAAGRYLVDRFFRPGASVRWDRLVEDATGEPLTPAYLAGDLAETT